MVVAGPLLALIDSTLRTGGSVLEVLGTLTGTSASALIDMDPSALRALEGMIVASGPGARVDLAGPAFSDVGGTLLIGSANAQIKAFLAILDGATVTGTSAAPFVSLVNSTLTTEGFLGMVGGAGGPGSLILGGPLLRAVGSSIAAADLLTIVRSSLDSSTAQALLQINGTTLTLGDPGRPDTTGRLLEVRASATTPSSAVLRGPLLGALSSTITTTSDVLAILDGGAVRGHGAAPLFGFAGSSVSAPAGHLVVVKDQIGPAGSTLFLAGPVLSAGNAAVTLGGDAVHLGALATVGSSTGAPLFLLNQSALSLASLVSADGPGRRLLTSGPILAAHNQTTVAAAKPLLSATFGGVIVADPQAAPLVAFNGGSTLSAEALLTAGLLDALVFTSGSTGALFAFNGGNHLIARPGSSAIELRGTRVADIELLAGESQPGGVTIEIIQGDGTIFLPLTVATDQPLRHRGALIDGDGATLAAARGVTLDKALFDASAPVVNLANGSTLTLFGGNGHAVSLVNQSRLESVMSPLMRLDASTLSILSGHGVNVAGGSFVRVLGADLLSLTNGSRLAIPNGNLLNITGNSAIQIVNGTALAIHNSQVTIGGAFVNVQAGSGLGIINSLSFTNIGGLPIAFTNGASPANVSINNPIQGAGQYSVHNSAAVIMSGPNASLTISGN